MRRSRAGRWRALSLLAVHLLIVGHVLHWLWAGETLTPVEPSEAMETIRAGRINAGFVFFAAALAATLILGRWVCGWGCHLVAYQDLTLWVLKKLHLRPKAFRSRLLLFIPLIAALYMFVWPAVWRVVMGLPQPRWEMHLTKTGFWDTFPGLFVAMLTVLVCGMAVIYFLGAKGFCTYACPYGAFFALTDRLATGRIRVTDDCNQCGHCTAVCTSNVDVAREVNTFGMVVDPGCMKCLDCVSVCPNNALYYGLGAPSLLAKARSFAPGEAPGAASERQKPAVRSDLSWGEELTAVIVFGGAFFAYRGLYGQVPFLLSLGIGGIISFLTIIALRLFYRRDVRIQKLMLKVDGRIRAMGIWWSGAIVLLLALTAHSGYWRYHDYLGGSAYAAAPAASPGWQYSPQYRADWPEDVRATIRRGLDHLTAARRAGLIPCPENDLKLAWLSLLAGQPVEATELVRGFVEAHRDDITAWVALAAYQTFAGHYDEARASFERALSLERDYRRRWLAKLGQAALPLSAHAWTEWGMFLAQRGQNEESFEALNKALRFDAGYAPAHLALGDLHLRNGRADEARRSYIRAVVLEPHDRAATLRLESSALGAQDDAQAVKDYDAALAAHPQIVSLHATRALALTRLRRYAEAASGYRTVLKLAPDFADAWKNLGAVLLASGDLAGAVREYEQIVTRWPDDMEAALRLALLYEESGRAPDAKRLYDSVARRGNAGEQQAARAALSRLP